jgi:broad specificity phosphatase PhoE
VLIAVRHGQTALNVGSADGEKSRGWLPVGLDRKGMADMAETAHDLAPLEGSIDGGLHTSDLPRAVQSAHEIGRSLGMELQPTERLRDWNLGRLAGHTTASILPTTHRLIDNPQEPAPDGESYQSFLDRAVPFLRGLVESPQVHMAVTHNRVMTLLHSLIQMGGKGIDPEVLKAPGPVKPSGLLIVGPDWRVGYIHKPNTEKDLRGAQPQGVDNSSAPR